MTADTVETTSPPPILSFESHLGRYVGPPTKPERALTLRGYYLAHVLPQIEHQSPGALSEDRTALTNWELHTGDPDLRTIDREHLVRLRDGMQAAGRAAGTINKTWREIKAILTVAADEDVIGKVPKIGIGMKSRLVLEAAKRQRETVTADEATRLWHACRFASYPDPTRFPTVRLWRTALLLLWLYGPRTQDVFRLDWASVLGASRTLRFTAMKTRKVQGLPLTDLVLSHLGALRGSDATQVFAGFRTPGAFHRTAGRWTRGYYTTWRTEILPAAGLADPVLFKHFREAMVTRHNGVEPGLGSWMAGHYVPGVSAQSYDLPTARIRAAIESAPVPECFRWPPPGAGDG